MQMPVRLLTPLQRSPALIDAMKSLRESKSAETGARCCRCRLLTTWRKNCDEQTLSVHDLLVCNLEHV